MPSRLGEVVGCLPVAIRESPFARAHRVRQVVGDVDPLERHWQRRWVEEVGDDDRRLREPGGDGPRVATHQDEFVSVRRKERDEATADVAARADDEDPHRVACRAYARNRSTTVAVSSGRSIWGRSPACSIVTRCRSPFAAMSDPAATGSVKRG